jgi:pyridoxamine 5'-phosphate oxidase family protein
MHLAHGERHDRMSWRVAARSSSVGMCSVRAVDWSRPRRVGERAMSVFSDAELAYLAKGKLGRLATIDGAGMPHVVPLGWRYNPALDTIDIGGRDFARTRKFRNAQHNPNVALVVDDVLPPGRPRCVMIRGIAEVLADAMMLCSVL